MLVQRSDQPCCSIRNALAYEAPCRALDQLEGADGGAERVDERLEHEQRLRMHAPPAIHLALAGRLDAAFDALAPFGLEPPGQLELTASGPLVLLASDAQCVGDLVSTRRHHGRRARCGRRAGDEGLRRFGSGGAGGLEGEGRGQHGSAAGVLKQELVHLSSGVIRGDQRSSAVISGHQWSSGVIRGHQMLIRSSCTSSSSDSAVP